MISTESASISMLIPLVKILEKVLNKHDDDSGIQTMKTVMLTSLQQRFKDIEGEESDVLLISTAIDPRFKDKFFTREAKKLAKKFIIDQCTSVEGEDNGPQRKRS